MVADPIVQDAIGSLRRQEIHPAPHRLVVVLEYLTVAVISIKLPLQKRKCRAPLDGPRVTAQALIHDPEVLILDEPTSGLDPNQIIEIREVIKQQGKNKTVLFSTHILQEVEALCDRVIIINKGEIVADDTLSNLQRGQTGKLVVKVKFQEAVDRNLLQQLNDVAAVEEVQPSTFNLETSNPETVRKQILELSLRNNLNIVSLQSENQSLEEVFHSLTQAG